MNWARAYFGILIVTVGSLLLLDNSMFSIQATLSGGRWRSFLVPCSATSPTDAMWSCP